MRITKWIPWNWFKKEEADVGASVPVQRASLPTPGHSVGQRLESFHREIDRLFEQAFRGFGPWPHGFGRHLPPMNNGAMLKPTLDLGATDKAYTITMEIPGVDAKDVQLEIVNDTLTIRGEKKQETEEKGKDYYRMERAYGSFQRVLSLPEDADQDGVAAMFKKGVLKITMPRKALPETKVKQIEVKAA